MSTVVAGVDDSSVSKEVLKEAIEQASWRQAEVHAVHVVRIPTMYTEIPVDVTDFIEAERTAVWEQLDPTTQPLGFGCRACRSRRLPA